MSRWTTCDGEAPRKESDLAAYGVDPDFMDTRSLGKVESRHLSGSTHHSLENGESRKASDQEIIVLACNCDKFHYRKAGR